MILIISLIQGSKTTLATCANSLGISTHFACRVFTHPTYHHNLSHMSSRHPCNVGCPHHVCDARAPRPCANATCEPWYVKRDTRDGFYFCAHRNSICHTFCSGSAGVGIGGGAHGVCAWKSVSKSNAISGKGK